MSVGSIRERLNSFLLIQVRFKEKAAAVAFNEYCERDNWVAMNTIVSALRSLTLSTSYIPVA